MKTLMIVLVALAVCCWNIPAQTNSPVSEERILKVDSGGTVFPIRLEESPLRLRLADEPRPDAQALPTFATTNSTPETPALEFSGETAVGRTLFTPGEQRIFQMLDEGGYLTPRKKSDNPIQRGIDAVFEPEVFQMGKIKWSASVATAVKRKNPLCLLSPLFFQMNW